MSVNVTDLYPKSSPQDFRVTTAFQGTRQRLSFVLYDHDGKVLNLTDTDMLEAGDSDAVPETKPDFDDGQLPTRAEDLEVQLIYRLGISSLNTPYAIIGKIEKPECGMVTFTLNPPDLRYAGIYSAQIQLGKKMNKAANIGTADELYTFYVYPAFINVEKNISCPYEDSLTITIPEVRMHMFDNDPAQNLTLDAVEFSDSEIMSAALHAVDIWNDTLPPVAYSDGSNFPYRAKWLDGTVAVLYQRIAHRKRRNTLQYSAGGVSIDDQNYQTYAAVAAQMMAEYKQWVEQKKQSINLQLGFGSYGGIGF